MQREGPSIPAVERSEGPYVSALLPKSLLEKEKGGATRRAGQGESRRVCCVPRSRPWALPQAGGCLRSMGALVIPMEGEETHPGDHKINPTASSLTQEELAPEGWGQARNKLM